MKRYWPEFGASILALLALPLLLQVTVGPDVSWQLWIGRHLNAGVPLYEWIMETNPPLWFWMAQPVSAIAAYLQISPNITLLAAIWCVMSVSLALSAAIIIDLSPRIRAGLLGAQLLAFVLLSFAEVGQRDHLALIGIVPYALMIARRAEGVKVAMPLALAIGLFAAPMIALKHYFVLLPIALEAWLWWRTKRLCPFRPELLALAIVAIVYALAVVILTPAYLADMVPMLRVAYGDFGGPPILMVLNKVTSTAVVVAFYVWACRKSLPVVTQALLIVAAMFVLTFFLQFKGFNYHQDPIVAALVMALLSQIVMAPPLVLEADRNSKLLWALSLIVLVVPAVMSGPYRNQQRDEMDPFFASLPDNSSVAVITPDPGLAWPMITDHDIKFGQRYYHTWMLHAVRKQRAADGSLPDDLTTILQRVRTEMVEDMTCNVPDIVMFDNQSPEKRTGVIQEFFEGNAAFAGLMSSYRWSERAGFLDVYRRISALPPADGLDCMPIGIGLEAPVVALDDDVKHDEAVAAVF